MLTRTLTPQADSFRFAVHEQPGAGTPIVLLHGAGSNALSWQPLMRSLSDRHVLAVDLPSHGKSDAARTWNIYETADLLLDALRTHLGERPAIFGGHSWGGKLSGCIAAQHREAVAGLILIDPSPSHSVPVAVDDFVEMSFGIELAPYATVEAAEEAARKVPRYANWHEDTRGSFRYGLRQLDDGSWTLRPTRDELRGLAAAVLWEDASELLAKNRGIPTLLVTASDSVWQAMTNGVVYEGADMVELPGGHWIHMDDEAGVAKAVGGWLARKFPL